MPLREALRGLRFLLQRGGEALVDTVVIEDLPKPAAGVVGAVLREVSGFARNVDDLASGLAKSVLVRSVLARSVLARSVLARSVLGGDDPSSLTLQDMGTGHNPDAAFGAAVYVALRSVLRRLGAPGVFVSEAAARRAYGPQGATDAAGLTVNLLDARVVRGTTAQEAARVPGAALEPVAIFAVMLWLQSTRSEDENEDALDAATDLAVALAAEIGSTCAARDTARIADLYARYVPHV